MIGLFKNAEFTKLFIANFASQLGSVIGNMAFAFYLLDRFSSQPYYATLAELMYSLPTLLVFLFVGVLADRFDRKKIAANSDWIRAGLTALLFLSIHYDWIAATFAILFLRSSVSKFFAPAEASLLQGIMQPEQYVQAAGLNQTVMGLFMLFGTGLGALTYHWIGMEGAVIVDGVSFILSGIMVTRCRFSMDVRLPNGKSRLGSLRLRAVTADFGEGLTYIRQNKLLLAIIIGFFMFGFVNGGFAILPMFTMKYKLSPEHYKEYASLITIFLGIGYLIGSAIGAALIKKFSEAAVVITGLLLSSVLCVTLAFAGQVWIYLTVILIVGIILAPVNVALGGWIPQLVDPSKMGRVNAWIEPLMMLAQSAALGVIAVAFPALVSIDVLYMLIGACILIASLYYLFVLPGLSRRHRQESAKSVTS